MGKRDDEYTLEDRVEHDEAFVTNATAARQKKELSRGRGSQQKAIVAMLAESTVIKDFENGILTRSFRYFKKKKIENLKTKTTGKLIRNLINKDAMLQADESTTFSKFEDYIYGYVKEISGTKEGRFNLK